jgi:hypothetical protein
MPAAIFNPVIDKGADYTFGLAFADSSGNPIDLTTVYLSSKILPKEGSSNVLGSFTISLDANIVGKAYFTIPASLSTAIVPSKPYFEIWVQYVASGVKKKYVKGILNIDQ